jgi:hypothetical protein
MTANLCSGVKNTKRTDFGVDLAMVDLAIVSTAARSSLMGFAGTLSSPSRY